MSRKVRTGIENVPAAVPAKTVEPLGRASGVPSSIAQHAHAIATERILQNLT